GRGDANRSTGDALAAGRAVEDHAAQQKADVDIKLLTMSVALVGTAEDGAQAGRAEQAAPRVAHLDSPRQDPLSRPGYRGRRGRRPRQGHGRIQDRRGESIPDDAEPVE